VTPEEYAKERAAEDELDLREALKSRRVSRFIRRIVFRACKLIDLTHTGAAPSHDFIDGQRSIGKWLVDEMFRVDPQLAAAWWAEYAEERLDQQTHAVRDPAEGDEA
jgi:hypothetical protein